MNSIARDTARLSPVSRSAGTVISFLVIALLSLGCVELAGDDLAGEESIGQRQAASEVTCDPYNPGTAWCNIWMNIWMNDWQNHWQHSWNNDWNTTWNQDWDETWSDSWEAAFTATWDAGWDNGWDFSSPKFAWADDSQCAHPVTQRGSALDATCSPVVEAVCSDSPACCARKWGNSCVNRALSYGAESSGVHDVMTGGVALSPSDSPCVAAVCNANASCCTTAWDDQCVEAAAQTCYSRYLTRTRFEDDRIMTDACIEPSLPGAAACPLAGTGSRNRECCRRALVLQGVYTVSDNTESQEGRSAEWQESITTDNTLINVTIVPDPVIEYADGTIEQSRPHHLWQAAGPGGTIYPDCSGSCGPRPCNALAYANVNPSLHTEMADLNHVGLEGGSLVPVAYRQLLVTVISTLITTNGQYEIDIRWLHNPAGSATLPPDADFDKAPVEGIWYGERIADPTDGSQYYHGGPWCFSSNTLTRSEGLVDNIATCNVAPAMASTIEVRFKQ